MYLVERITNKRKKIIIRNLILAIINYGITKSKKGKTTMIRFTA
jgi:hypothetical protein